MIVITLMIGGGLLTLPKKALSVIMMMVSAVMVFV